jgi:hypothetical protein
MLGLGNNLNELKIRIQKGREDLANIGAPVPSLPEIINMTNILRANEYLTKTDYKKTELISNYEEYTNKLEQIIASLLSIQTDLRDIIKTEASLIEGDTMKSKTKKQTAKKRKKH